MKARGVSVGAACRLAGAVAAASLVVLASSVACLSADTGTTVDLGRYWSLAIRGDTGRAMVVVRVNAPIDAMLFPVTRAEITARPRVAREFAGALRRLCSGDRAAVDGAVLSALHGLSVVLMGSGTTCGLGVLYDAVPGIGDMQLEVFPLSPDQAEALASALESAARYVAENI